MQTFIALDGENMFAWFVAGRKTIPQKSTYRIQVEIDSTFRLFHRFWIAVRPGGIRIHTSTGPGSQARGAGS